jgi:hypothetical protein
LSVIFNIVPKKVRLMGGAGQTLPYSSANIVGLRANANGTVVYKPHFGDALVSMDLSAGETVTVQIDTVVSWTPATSGNLHTFESA